MIDESTKSTRRNKNLNTFYIRLLFFFFLTVEQNYFSCRVNIIIRMTIYVYNNWKYPSTYK